MMQPFLPLAVALRSTKTLCMGFERRPYDQHQILTLRFDTWPDIQLEKPRRRLDERQCFAHRRFEAGLHARPNLQERMFENHCLLPVQLRRSSIDWLANR